MSSKLSPLNIIAGSFVLFARHWGTLLGFLGLPIGAFIAFSTFYVKENNSLSNSMILVIMQLLLTVLISYFIFNLILLKKKPRSMINILIIDVKKLTLFKIYISIYIRIFAVFFVLYLFSSFFYTAPTFDENGKIDKAQIEMFHDLVRYLFLPCSYILARYCLALPANAIGIKMILSEAWAASRPNHIQLYIILGIFPWLLDAVLFKINDIDTSIANLILYQSLYFSFTVIKAITIALCFEKICPPALFTKTTPTTTSKQNNDNDQLND